jgi:hypothetical protein
MVASVVVVVVKGLDLSLQLAGQEVVFQEICAEVGDA